MDAARDHLEASLGWSFRDEELLRQAMSHRSWCAEHAEDPSNERLEFLGDAVLGIVVTDHIFRTYPDHQEGVLAKVRASVVNADVLADVAAGIGIGRCLRLGKGEDTSGGREKPSILADAMEAVIAAVYLDGGIDAAWGVVMRLFADRIVEAAEGPGGDDYKTRLQELAARRYERLPRYQVRDEGPDHAKRFYATVVLGGEPYGHGEGGSKKQAEQAAARAAWQRITADGPPTDEGRVGDAGVPSVAAGAGELTDAGTA
jgi:ribonuclease-3